MCTTLSFLLQLSEDNVGSVVYDDLLVEWEQVGGVWVGGGDIDPSSLYFCFSDGVEQSVACDVGCRYIGGGMSPLWVEFPC